MSQQLISIRVAGLLAGGALLGALTGCIGYVDRADRRGHYEERPVLRSTVVIEDDYIYYPDYECYYSASRHQYAYPDGRNWVWRPAPRGVTVDVLFASPSVRMDFHDSPARHHEVIVRQYPRGWSPARANQERKENRRDESHEQREQRHDNH